MKLLSILILFILLIIPVTVNANITCNDGTTSPTCIDCHTGCCSGHNGCTDNPNNNSQKKRIENNNENSYSLSFTDFILILISLLPWIISFLILLCGTIKDIVEVIINKIKNRK